MCKIIFWMLIIQSGIGLLPALHVWQWPSMHVLPWVVIIAFTGTFSHFCMAKALQYADATVVIPMDFLRVPLTAVLGWLIYAERIDMFTAVGAALHPFRQPSQSQEPDRLSKSRRSRLSASIISETPAITLQPTLLIGNLGGPVKT